MLLLRHACRRATVHSLSQHGRLILNRHASRISIPTPPPFPVVDACPSPTCQCQETPSGLDIDRAANLNGTIAAYAEQILISTGHSDWPSRIEEDKDATLVHQLKHFLGRGGKYTDPFHNVMITNSSIPPTPFSNRQQTYESPSNPDATHSKPGTDPDVALQAGSSPSAPASAYLLPSFTYVPTIPTDPSAVEAFLKAFVLPTQLHVRHDALSRAEQNVLKRQPEMIGRFPGSRNVDEILILVCGHGGRDQRCGVMGPVLIREFEDKLARQGVEVLSAPPAIDEVVANPETDGWKPRARVASISHIGGHKFAGNVIVYLPPAMRDNALRGKGIWYGRVEPGNVEGIVRETVLGGKVIRELFRGGVGQDGEILRL